MVSSFSFWILGGRGTSSLKFLLLGARSLLIVFPWFPTFNPYKALEQEIPVWIYFPEFHPLLRSTIGELAKSLGKPIHIPKKKLVITGKIAKVCVLWDVNKPIPHFALLDMGNKKYYKTAVKFGPFPNACYFCKQCGHFAKFCERNPNSIKNQRQGKTNLDQESMPLKAQAVHQNKRVDASVKEQERQKISLPNSWGQENVRNSNFSLQTSGKKPIASVPLLANNPYAPLEDDADAEEIPAAQQFRDEVNTKHDSQPEQYKTFDTTSATEIYANEDSIHVRMESRCRSFFPFQNRSKLQKSKMLKFQYCTVQTIRRIRIQICNLRRRIKSARISLTVRSMTRF